VTPVWIRPAHRGLPTGAPKGGVIAGVVHPEGRNAVEKPACAGLLGPARRPGSRQRNKEPDGVAPPRVSHPVCRRWPSPSRLSTATEFVTHASYNSPTQDDEGSTRWISCMPERSGKLLPPVAREDRAHLSMPASTKVNGADF